MMNVADKRFYVRINAGPKPGGNPTIYHNSGFRFEAFMKWCWYFDYLAASYKVSNPRHYVNVDKGNYDYLPPVQERIKEVKGKIAGKRRKLSEYENKLMQAESSWRELFSITDDPMYKRALAKIEALRSQLEVLEFEYAELNKIDTNENDKK
ncbi:hypothetical protein QTN47_27250 [Danxiaibacter flavus]|uniref:Uncharacterized protein n=1 Tax=Danxiaibacter flavus TaxID=3049108 RepID=A0ABV3ZMX5_9BACT|nr:hypothetical protein QNM32_27250 [Chitinophagaceae bacterium DXS]